MKDGRAPCHKLAFGILTTICNIHPIIYARTYLCIRVTSLTAPLFHIYRWNAWASYLRMSRWVFVANSGTLRYRNRGLLLTYSTSFRMFFQSQFTTWVWRKKIITEMCYLSLSFFMQLKIGEMSESIDLCSSMLEKVAISFRALLRSTNPCKFYFYPHYNNVVR